VHVPFLEQPADIDDCACRCAWFSPERRAVAEAVIGELAPRFTGLRVGCREHRLGHLDVTRVGR
jgi:hypothetical protein